MKHLALMATLILTACGGTTSGGGGATPPTPTPAGACVVGGCSNTVCQAADAEPAMTTCEYQAAYACYATATCAPQPDGACGWTPTDELTACLADPPALAPAAAPAS